MTVCHGASRIVFLVGGYAIKIPRFWRWKGLLLGLIAQMQEVEFGRTGWPEFCPVVFWIPGGFLVVMRRADELTQAQFDAIDFDKFANQDGYYCFVEPKIENMGMLDGRIVAVDYGN